MDDRSRSEGANAATGRPGTLVWILAAVASTVLIAWLWGRSVGTVAPGSVGFPGDRDGPPGEVGPGRRGEEPLPTELSMATQAPVTGQDRRAPWEAPDVLVHLELEGAEDRDSAGWTFFASSREPLAAGEDPTPRLEGGLQIEYEWLRSADEEARGDEFLEPFHFDAVEEARASDFGSPSWSEFPDMLAPTALVASLRSPDVPAEVLASPRPGLFPISIRPWVLEDVPEGRVHLRACHPLYADGHIEIVPSRAVREALGRGESSVIEATMRVEGICVLEGRVEGIPEGSPAVALTSPSFDPDHDDPITRVEAIGSEFLWGEDLEVFDVHRLVQDPAIGSTPNSVAGGFVALFPLEAGIPAARPIAQSSWRSDGGFRLEVPDPGPYCLVVVRLGRAPLTIFVELQRRAVVTPPAPMRFRPSSGIQGLVPVDELGELYGYEVVAVREGESADQEHPWGAAYDFTWGRHGFEVQRVVGQPDPDGAFFLGAAGPGDYRLDVGVQGALDLRGPEVVKSEGVRVTSPAVGVLLRPNVVALELDFDLPRGLEDPVGDVPAEHVSISLRSEMSDVAAEFDHLATTPLRIPIRMAPGDFLHVTVESSLLERKEARVGPVRPGSVERLPMTLVLR